MVRSYQARSTASRGRTRLYKSGVKIKERKKESSVKFPADCPSSLAVSLKTTNMMRSGTRLLYWAFTWLLCLVAVVSGEFVTSFASKETGQVQVDEYHLRRQETTDTYQLECPTAYYSCPTHLGDGCCPQGLACNTNGGCDPPVITSIGTTVYCDVRQFACEASLGGKSHAPLCNPCRIDSSPFLGGCCPVGGVCGFGDCTRYSPMTTTMTLTSGSGTGTEIVVSTMTAGHVSSQVDPLTSIISVEISGTHTPA